MPIDVRASLLCSQQKCIIVQHHKISSQAFMYALSFHIEVALSIRTSQDLVSLCCMQLALDIMATCLAT